MKRLEALVKSPEPASNSRSRKRNVNLALDLQQADKRLRAQLALWRRAAGEALNPRRSKQWRFDTYARFILVLVFVLGLVLALGCIPGAEALRHRRPCDGGKRPSARRGRDRFPRAQASPGAGAPRRHRAPGADRPDLCRGGRERHRRRTGRRRASRRCSGGKPFIAPCPHPRPHPRPPSSPENGA